ncbi:TPA: DUF2063 domain-containing protein, partial [Neisseria gonorrhoeae]
IIIPSLSAISENMEGNSPSQNHLSA